MFASISLAFLCISTFAGYGESGNRVSYTAGEQFLQMGSEEDRDIYIIITRELEAYHNVGGGEKRLTLMRPGHRSACLKHLAYVGRT